MAVIFCGTICIFIIKTLPVKKYGALYCPDFPLSCESDKAIYVELNKEQNTIKLQIYKNINIYVAYLATREMQQHLLHDQSESWQNYDIQNYQV